MPSPSPKPARDPLLGAICHDLRAPLASVTMGASFVLQATPEDEANARVRRILQAMLRSCTKMDRLVRDFADLSEIEAGTVELRIGRHDAREMLVLAAESAREAATSRRIELEVDAPERVTVTCDRDRVLRATGHLVDNAVKHAPEGSAVTIAATLGERGLTIRVTDRGPGLSEEARRHLFEAWGKSRGLAIARGLAEAHGGTLELEPRQGEATTFALTLPSGAVSVT